MERVSSIPEKGNEIHPRWKGRKERLKESGEKNYGERKRGTNVPKNIVWRRIVQRMVENGRERGRGRKRDTPFRGDPKWETNSEGETDLRTTPKKEWGQGSRFGRLTTTIYSSTKKGKSGSKQGLEGSNTGQQGLWDWGGATLGNWRSKKEDGWWVEDPRGNLDDSSNRRRANQMEIPDESKTPWQGGGGWETARKKNTPRKIVQKSPSQLWEQT